MTLSPPGSPELLVLSEAGQRSEEVELVGPHLRLRGRILVGRFNRLSDFINHTRGYVMLRDARLMRRNGAPTNVAVDELMVNQDEITFVGQAAGTSRSGAGLHLAPADFDRPAMEKVARRYVVFTPGHRITGTVHVHREMSLHSFVDTPDPRFVVMTGAVARSLVDRRVISHFDLALINRTQMTAAAEVTRAGAVGD